MGALNLFRISCGTVLGFNPQKHGADKQTGTRMSRHTDRSSLDTNTRFAQWTYAFAQRHKSDKNIPVNLAKTATAALPFLY